MIWDSAQSSCNSTGKKQNIVDGDNFIVIVLVDYRWRRRSIRWLEKPPEVKKDLAWKIPCEVMKVELKVYINPRLVNLSLAGQ